MYIMTDEPLRVGVCLAVVGRPETKPFIHIYQRGVSLTVGGVIETMQCIESLRQAMEELMAIEERIKQS